MEHTKLYNFTQLVVWQKGHKLVLEVYKETKKFPQEERYSLTDQMRRAAVSITSNIAEGFARRSIKEKCQFYSTSLASATELQNQLFVARDVGYLKNNFQQLFDSAVEVSRMLQGLMAQTKKRS